MFDIKDGIFLVKLARNAIITYLGKKDKPHLKEIPEKMKEKGGVFVTLNILNNGKEELRGCIGYPEKVLPLFEATINAAISAAIGDPRFKPVTISEINNILIEVSILTSPILIEVDDPKKYPKKIKVGKDGIIIEKGPYRGLLLPQVPIEWNWDEEEFLSQCCLKAGLAPDFWLIKGTNIYKFQAIIFKEKEPDGAIEHISLDDII